MSSDEIEEVWKLCVDNFGGVNFKSLKWAINALGLSTTKEGVKQAFQTEGNITFEAFKKHVLPMLKKKDDATISVPGCRYFIQDT
jgi:hypothetical protein